MYLFTEFSRYGKVLVFFYGVYSALTTKRAKTFKILCIYKVGFHLSYLKFLIKHKVDV